MRYSLLVSKTIKSIPADEVSVNASLLIKAGYIEKVAAGVYSYLPLGLRTLQNIVAIIREEMNVLGASEILMPAITPKDVWQKTNRWDSLDVLFKVIGHDDKEYALGATHEEIVTPLVQRFARSYKDFPVSVYQIQTKFRNEPRAKSGLLRGREFLMKDLYSFHQNQQDLDSYYERVENAYARIFDRLGIGSVTHKTFASGGAFSKYSHEYQTVSEVGEDTIYLCPCGLAYNKEIIPDVSTCEGCGASPDSFTEKRAIETGNIFKLGTRFSAAFDYRYADSDGSLREVYMGCYGIGPSRIMGTLVELFHDDKGIIWPHTVTPYRVHLLSLGNDELVAKTAEKLYGELVHEGFSVLYDDREESAGTKLADADLLGIPYRIVISKKTLEKKSAEMKLRSAVDAELVPLKTIVAHLKT